MRAHDRQAQGNTGVCEEEMKPTVRPSFFFCKTEGVCILVCTVKGAFSATEKTKTQVNVFYDQTASNTQVM
jgi:hypothetical protein